MAKRAVTYTVVTDDGTTITSHGFVEAVGPADPQQYILELVREGEDPDGGMQRFLVKELETD